MTRRYGHTISITTATATAAVTRAARTAGSAGVSGASGELPTGFRWNGVAYRVVEVLGAWHLCARWWETGEQELPLQPPAPDHARGHVSGHVREPLASASDRYYYRLRCASGLICEIYHDQVSDAWVLDCVYD